MRRICRTGAMPIRTAHDEAAVARTVWAMALLHGGALAVRTVLASYLVRGASTITVTIQERPGTVDSARAPYWRHACPTSSRLLALGGRRVDIGQTGEESWTVLADPEGNEFCVIRPKETLIR
jgi:hypothetical protein